ncbi:RNA methyltransferase [Rasiella rasia]|uniref:RNA methyltransferase n=1 Tax=Rasiella rasia TaxID=2744027 RepID=A0A6G6GHJ6_9FLAO|nr:RNA methyltransferase [Rasiella rasia]QIE58018.1 RNA methyltransferase [Rasiella rasia]
MYKSISSTQNSLVKQIAALIEKSRDRKKSGLFVIEGAREIALAKKGGYCFKQLLFCAEIFVEDPTRLTTDHTEIIKISEEVYQKLAYRTTTEGVLAVAEAKDHSVANSPLENDNPLVLVAEAPEKPGNIGALLRTADAANVDLVIIANPRTDIYNPNIIRSSVGCIFTNSVITGTTAEILQFLKSQNIQIYSAILQDSIPYHRCDFTKPTALVVGTEATGLTEEWRTQSTQNIIIPMQGEIDSMNVSVAAGILIFEAKRQRKFK